MLYMTGDGMTLIILETENLESIKQGRPAKTPDGKILIAWTPDAIRLAKQIAASDGDPLVISGLVDESIKWPQAPARPYHETSTVNIKEKK